MILSILIIFFFEAFNSLNNKKTTLFLNCEIIFFLMVDNRIPYFVCDNHYPIQKCMEKSKSIKVSEL